MQDLTIRNAQPQHIDVIRAKFVGTGHKYSKTMLERAGTNLLEVLMCRERELEAACALLSERNRKRLGV